MDFSKLNEFDGTEKAGFSVHLFLHSFNQAFYKSARKHFVDFLNEFKDINKWMVFSDYAMHDKKKKNDVITFTIVPYILEFHEYSTLLNWMAPNDLKKTRTVRPEFIEFLANGPIFNISIVLSRKRRLHNDEREYHIKSFEMMIAQLEIWCETTPEAKGNYIELIKKISILKQEVVRPGANLKVIRDIEIISTLAAYFIFEITKLIDIDKISWLSDRDTLLTYKAAKIGSPIIFDLIHHLYYLFCMSENIESKDKLILAIPESDSDGNVWFDSFNRIPDFISGALADYDYKQNTSTHEKFVQVIEKVFPSNKRNIFFSIEFTSKGFAVSRLEWCSKK